MSLATPGKKEFAFCGELLDSVVVELTHVDMAACIGGNTHGRREFSLLTTMTSPSKEEFAFRRENLHTIQLEISYIDISTRFYGDIQGPSKLARPVAALPEGT